MAKDKKKVIGQLEQAFALDCSIPEACYYAWIHKDTYYDWLKRDATLSDRFKALRNKPVLLARTEVIKGFKWNPELALKYLERKRKDEFSTKKEVNNNIHIKEINEEDLED